MNTKLACALLISFASFSAVAGSCNNASLKGPYSYQFEGVIPWETPSGTIFSATLAQTGRITFNGAGKATFSAIETANGKAVNVSGSGTYSVNSACAMSGSVNWTNGNVTSFRMYLDQMDDAPATRVAYHGTGIAWTPKVGFSGNGNLYRLVGKF